MHQLKRLKARARLCKAALTTPCIPCLGKAEKTFLKKISGKPGLRILSPNKNHCTISSYLFSFLVKYLGFIELSIPKGCGKTRILWGLNLCEYQMYSSNCRVQVNNTSSENAGNFRKHIHRAILCNQGQNVLAATLCMPATEGTVLFLRGS